MIEKITKEQQSKIPYYLKKWTNIGFSSEPIDQEKAKSVLLNYVKILKIKPKKFFFLPSPKACQDEANKYFGTNKFYEFNFFTIGNLNAGYCAFYDFLIEEVIKPDKKVLELWYQFRELSYHLHYFLIFKNEIFISERPIKIKTNSENNLDCNFGAAVKYRDGFSLYFKNGEYNIEIEKTIKQMEKKISNWKVLNEK